MSVEGSVDAEGCVTGFARIRYADHTLYVGDCLQGKPHGQGVCTFHDTSRYDGEWQQGQPHGTGTYKGSTDHPDSYEGDWKHGYRHGVGTITTAAGHQFHGTWENDLPVTRGSIVTSNSSRLTGDIRDGRFEGKFTLTLKDGGKLVGTVAGGGHGSGKFYTKDEVHSGSFNCSDTRRSMDRDNGDEAPPFPETISRYFMGELKLCMEIDLQSMGRIRESQLSILQGVVRQQRHVPALEAQESSLPASLRLIAERLPPTWNPAFDNQDADTQSDYTWVTDIDEEESTMSGRDRARTRRLIWADGTVFEGSLNKEKRPQGPGELRASNGALYRGEWRDGKMHGSGIYVAEGGRYVGFVTENKRSGYGKLVSRSGAIYEGTWLDDKPHGQGKYSKPESNVSYEGGWVDGKAEGHGTFTSASWGTYVGDWRADCKEGRGKVLYVSGASYEGTWLADEAHGWGRYTWPDGSYFEGRFVRGNMAGPGKYLGSNLEESYVGDWSNNMKHGYGRMRYADGAVYEGDWQNDKPHGSGTFVNPYGVLFRGQWEEGSFKTLGSACHDERGVRTCVVEGVTYGSIRGDSHHKEEDINSRTVVPAPPPGHAEVEKHLPCPRKYLQINPGESFEEQSNVFESVVYPRGPDPTRAGYLYRTCFGTEYWPSSTRSKLSDVDGGRLITVDSESRLYNDEEISFVDHNEIREHFEEVVVDAGPQHREEMSQIQQTTNRPATNVVTSETLDSTARPGLYLPATREVDYLHPPPTSNQAHSVSQTVAYTSPPVQTHTVSTVQESQYICPVRTETAVVESATKARDLPPPLVTPLATARESMPQASGQSATFMTPSLLPFVSLNPDRVPPPTCTHIVTESHSHLPPPRPPLETYDHGPAYLEARNTHEMAQTSRQRESVEEVHTLSQVCSRHQGVPPPPRSRPENPVIFEEISLRRNIPIPVEHNLVTEFVLPRIRTSTRAVPVPVYAPRIIEVPVMVEDLTDEGLAMCDSIQREVDQFYSSNAVSGTALETLADSLISTLHQCESSSHPIFVNEGGEKKFRM